MTDSEDRAALEAQLEQKAAAQSEFESQVKLKIENLTAGIYCDLCSTAISKDDPSFSPDRAYKSAFEAALLFASRMWNVKIQNPAMPTIPPAPAEGSEEELPETD